jgi:hypothetical protein
MPLFKWHSGKSMIVLLCIFAIGLTSCLPSPTVEPLPTDTPTPTITVTPTVVWFPPTETATPPPTVVASPTQEFRPGIGNLILEDDFSDPDTWLIGQMPNGLVSLGNNELSLALTQPKGYIFSVRNQPTLDNFYAEITVSPNLCTGLDEYGMLVRYNGPADFYRFSLSCNGQVRLDKIYGGGGSSPQPWMFSTSVPTGSPSTSRLGVWVVGQELRFFINDEFQFSITDRTFSRGMFGVFARSAGETAVTVSFSNLAVYDIQQE